MTKFSRGLNLVSGLDAPLVGKTFFFEHDFFCFKKHVFAYFLLLLCHGFVLQQSNFVCILMKCVKNMV